VQDPRDRLALNPFYVLELRPDCPRVDIERQGQKLLGMLALDLSAAKSYATPVGARPRTAELVRQAMAELRDPDKRIGHELWARLPSAPLPAAKPTQPAPPPFPQAPIVLGWKAR
jgi:hypothetical protein